MRKSTRYSLLLTLALVAALFCAVALRKKAPPEVARLLPESDAIVYANIAPLRTATHFERTPVHHSPDYQHFIDATGIVPERDLDAVAFGLHRMDDPRGPNGPVAYSEVFEGRFDGARLGAYLRGIATSQETYAGHQIYTLPVEGRSLRIAQLGYDTIAASNMPTPEQIHSILDRYSAAASPFAGSSLLGARYGDVPLLSSAWAIGHIGLPFSERGYITVSGLQLPLSEDTTFIASVRYLGALHLRIEQIAPSEGDAAQSEQALRLVVSLFRSLQSQQPRTPEDTQLRQMTDTLKVEQRRDRTILTATLPIDLLRQLATPPAGADTAPRQP